jgi:hypothetical protein
MKRTTTNRAAQMSKTSEREEAAIFGLRYLEEDAVDIQDVVRGGFTGQLSNDGSPSSPRTDVDWMN